MRNAIVKRMDLLFDDLTDSTVREWCYGRVCQAEALDFRQLLDKSTMKLNVYKTFSEAMRAHIRCCIERLQELGMYQFLMDFDRYEGAELVRCKLLTNATVSFIVGFVRPAFARNRIKEVLPKKDVSLSAIINLLMKAAEDFDVKMEVFLSDQQSRAVPPKAESPVSFPGRVAKRHKPEQPGPATEDRISPPFPTSSPPPEEHDHSCPEVSLSPADQSCGEPLPPEVKEHEPEALPRLLDRVKAFSRTNCVVSLLNSAEAMSTADPPRPKDNGHLAEAGQALERFVHPEELLHHQGEGIDAAVKVPLLKSCGVEAVNKFISDHASYLQEASDCGLTNPKSLLDCVDLQTKKSIGRLMQLPFEELTDSTIKEWGCRRVYEAELLDFRSLLGRSAMKLRMCRTYAQAMRNHISRYDGRLKKLGMYDFLMDFDRHEGDELLRCKGLTNETVSLIVASTQPAVARRRFKSMLPKEDISLSANIELLMKAAEDFDMTKNVFRSDQRPGNIARSKRRASSCKSAAKRHKPEQQEPDPVAAGSSGQPTPDDVLRGPAALNGSGEKVSYMCWRDCVSMKPFKLAEQIDNTQDLLYA
jgi:hypothetical protein